MLHHTKQLHEHIHHSIKRHAGWWHSWKQNIGIILLCMFMHLKKEITLSVCNMCTLCMLGSEGSYERQWTPIQPGWLSNKTTPCLDQLATPLHKNSGIPPLQLPTMYLLRANWKNKFLKSLWFSAQITAMSPVLVNGSISPNIANHSWAIHQVNRKGHNILATIPYRDNNTERYIQSHHIHRFLLRAWAPHTKKHVTHELININAISAKQSACDNVIAH